ncbi:hypothetical protein GCM10009839_86270 [Catenulispora yoronensis]|uniref:Uncharacterized protein n=1 Tax=Catenulispora yoronensis TaxID=450799 RepID=A0ABN2VH91_9ACTN
MIEAAIAADPVGTAGTTSAETCWHQAIDIPRPILVRGGGPGPSRPCPLSNRPAPARAGPAPGTGGSASRGGRVFAAARDRPRHHDN